MRALILSSRCTVEQRRALLELRAFLEGCGDTCEMLDWLSFLSDTVSEINAHSRKLVRRHIQELLAGAFQSNSRKEEEPKEKGVRRLIEISVKELARFIRRDALSSDAAKRETREKLEKFALEKRQPVVKTGAPTIQSSLRHHILKMPEAVYEASGIVVNGRRLKSFVFSTDLAIIRNCDADAVFAVYPFTPQQAISEAIIKAAYVPVFCGVGGGTTKGVRTVGLAKDAEAQGAMGLVLNAPISNPNLRAVTSAVDIPVVITVVSEDTNIARRLEHGATILNVAGAAETPAIIRKIREQYPSVPIIASGGNTNESIRETIRAGANAVTYTPPSTKEIFRVTMSKYRES